MEGKHILIKILCKVTIEHYRTRKCFFTNIITMIKGRRENLFYGIGK